MTSLLRALLALFAIVFFLQIVRFIEKEKLQLRYSLLWMLLSVLMLLAAAFPGLVSAAARLLGVHLTSNFVFLAAVVFLLAITLSLCVVVSWQAKGIRVLTQRVALMEKKLADREDSSCS